MYNIYCITVMDTMVEKVHELNKNKISLSNYVMYVMMCIIISKQHYNECIGFSCIKWSYTCAYTCT